MEDKEVSAECRKTNATQAGYRKRVMRRINEDSHTQEPVARCSKIEPRTVTVAFSQLNGNATANLCKCV
ncbi:unnamed protein product [Brugia pahangi]|uniref:HTH_Tnp_IS630 domain-containing protein n=1 Tax=Brugia pahangi TaxID=6280 RepID=A0A0N4TST8_BRUPA|nr:unnamed protein product [Brugia pahangi]